MGIGASSTTPVLEPETIQNTRLLPPYHVIIENDEDHSMDFVIQVIRKVFGYDQSKAFTLMMQAHEKGEAIVWTGPKEVAELKVDQIRTFHEKHWKTGKELGPVGCRMEPAA